MGMGEGDGGERANVDKNLRREPRTPGAVMGEGRHPSLLHGGTPLTFQMVDFFSIPPRRPVPPKLNPVLWLSYKCKCKESRGAHLHILPSVSPLFLILTSSNITACNIKAKMASGRATKHQKNCSISKTISQFGTDRSRTVE